MAASDLDPHQAPAKSRRMPRRALATAVTAAALAVGFGGALAIAGGGPPGGGGSHGSAASAEYKPGKGCGDKNHIHTGPPGNPSNTDCPHH
jgi:hypothetical protein